MYGFLTTGKYHGKLYCHFEACVPQVVVQKMQQTQCAQVSMAALYNHKKQVGQAQAEVTKMNLDCIR
jgi:hypothetical protein